MKWMATDRLSAANASSSRKGKRTIATSSNAVTASSTAVQADKIDAAYKDGVPEVNLLKKEEVKPKKVTVN